MKGLIYIATNRFNGRSYIGQTRASLENRMRQHIRDAKRPDSVNTFHFALAQYGESGFDWSILDEFEGTKEEVIHALNVAEEYHILKHKTRISEYGYNATQGGYASDKFDKAVNRKIQYKPVLQYDIDGNFIRGYDSITDVCREFGLKNHTNFVARGMWRGFQWRVKENENFPRKIDAYVRPKRSSSVLVYDSDGNFYKEYDSINKCKADLGKSFALRELKNEITIQRHTIGKMLVFRKRMDNYPQKIEVKVHYPKEKAHRDAPIEIPVLQYTREGKFMREYPSIQAAEIETGICNKSIRLWCNREEPIIVRGKDMTKYVWRFKDGEIRDRIDIRGYEVKEYVAKMEHRIIQYSKDGEFICIWKNTHTASLQTGESANTIIKQCKGMHTRKPSMYLWRNYSEDFPLSIKVA